MVQNVNICLPKDCFERPLLTYVDTLPEASEAIKDTIYVVNSTNRWFIVDDTPEFVPLPTGSGGAIPMMPNFSSNDSSVNIRTITAGGGQYKDFSVAHDVFTQEEVHSIYYGE